MDLEDKISEFKTDLTTKILSYEEVFQRHIVDGNTYFFEYLLRDISKEYTTKSLIADYLGTHAHEVIFVGSAKLGFSLRPSNLFNKFDSKFSSSKENRDRSDIDIAVVSERLFDSISQNIFNYTDSLNNKWIENEYYSGGKEKKFDVPVCYKYFEYFSKGWFRPDMKPKGYDFCAKNSFEELKRAFYQDYKRKIGLGIYKNWFFFKHYHINNLKNLSFRVNNDII